MKKIIVLVMLIVLASFAYGKCTNKEEQCGKEMIKNVGVYVDGATLDGDTLTVPSGTQITKEIKTGITVKIGETNIKSSGAGFTLAGKTITSNSKNLIFKEGDTIEVLAGGKFKVNGVTYEGDKLESIENGVKINNQKFINIPKEQTVSVQDGIYKIGGTTFNAEGLTNSIIYDEKSKEYKIDGESNKITGLNSGKITGEFSGTDIIFSGGQILSADKLKVTNNEDEEAEFEDYEYSPETKTLKAKSVKVPKGKKLSVGDITIIDSLEDINGKFELKQDESGIEIRNFKCKYICLQHTQTGSAFSFKPNNDIADNTYGDPLVRITKNGNRYSVYSNMVSTHTFKKKKEIYSKDYSAAVFNFDGGDLKSIDSVENEAQKKGDPFVIFTSDNTRIPIINEKNSIESHSYSFEKGEGSSGYINLESGSYVVNSGDTETTICTTEKTTIIKAKDGKVSIKTQISAKNPNAQFSANKEFYSDDTNMVPEWEFSSWAQTEYGITKEEANRLLDNCLQGGGCSRDSDGITVKYISHKSLAAAMDLDVTGTVDKQTLMEDTKKTNDAWIKKRTEIASEIYGQDVTFKPKLEKKKLFNFLFETGTDVKGTMVLSQIEENPSTPNLDSYNLRVAEKKYLESEGKSKGEYESKKQIRAMGFTEEDIKSTPGITSTIIATLEDKTLLEIAEREVKRIKPDANKEDIYKYWVDLRNVNPHLADSNVITPGDIIKLPGKEKATEKSVAQTNSITDYSKKIDNIPKSWKLVPNLGNNKDTKDYQDNSGNFITVEAGYIQRVVDPGKPVPLFTKTPDEGWVNPKNTLDTSKKKYYSNRDGRTITYDKNGNLDSVVHNGKIEYVKEIPKDWQAIGPGPGDFNQYYKDKQGNTYGVSNGWVSTLTNQQAATVQSKTEQKIYENGKLLAPNKRTNDFLIQEKHCILCNMMPFKVEKNNNKPQIMIWDIHKVDWRPATENELYKYSISLDQNSPPTKPTPQILDLDTYAKSNKNVQFWKKLFN